jgi:hypothetical protein
VNRALALALTSIIALTSTAHAEGSLYAGGIAQPEAMWVQTQDNSKITNPQQSGFVLNHARGYAMGKYRGRYLYWEARIEAEFVPSFTLLDAYAAVSGELPKQGYWKITAGQHFVPFSRQTSLSVGDLQFTNYAQLVSLTPGRQLGATATLAIPYAPWLQAQVGMYNGKGINIIQNIDNNFEYVGRLAFRPIGPRAPLIESALGPDAVWVAVDFSYNRQNFGTYNQYQWLVGADAALSMKGFSFYGEYLWGHTTYSANAPKQKFHEQGINLQAGYLLPIPGFLYRRLEVAFRFEAVAPNQTVPITGPGDPTQARASYVAGVSYYHRGHNLKLQLNYFHNQELDDKTPDGRDATYRNDSVVLSMTYRLE